MKFNRDQITISNLWDVITRHEGDNFATKKGLPFAYS